jgi:hypothetical protein
MGGRLSGSRVGARRSGTASRRPASKLTSLGLGLHEGLRRSDGCHADVLSLTSLNAAVRGESERGDE